MSDLSSVRERSQILARKDREHIAQLVRLRRYVEATQADVAGVLGVETSWVTEIEAYDSDPRLSELRRYENAVIHLTETR